MINGLEVTAVGKEVVLVLQLEEKVQSRLVSNYAGVYIPSDYNNDVLVRGNRLLLHNGD